MPMKSEPRTRESVGTTFVTTASWEVASDCWMTLLTMYIMSSMAEVMCGGSAFSGRWGFSVRPDGDSSSWKAFSTERRKKKVVIALKGDTRRSLIFWARGDSRKKLGSSNRLSSSASSSPED